jgi:proteasome accessory factor A
VSERLLGIETEYACSALDPNGRRIDTLSIARKLVGLAAENLPSLPAASSSGIYLANGSRLYVDAGAHPELSTPECASPSDVVCYQLAGDRILTDLSAQLVADAESIAEIVLTRCNVDYSGSESTWGCHESYLYRGDSEVIARHIVPHFVSRIIFTGAGGFDNRSSGVRFLLSPRVPHLHAERSSSSTDNRGIFHNKDESLSGESFHRLHVLCGESSCSRIAAWLKLGTTALVVAMIENGVRPARGIHLSSPVKAMREFARDLDCRVEVSSQTGAPLTAVGIQRHYLEQAEAHIGDSFMPSWAEDVCRVWRTTLDEIERGTAALGAKLDWAIKRALFGRHAERRGFGWQSLAHWTEVADQFSTAIGESGYKGRTITAEEVLSKESPVPDTVQRLAPVVEGYGLSWDGLRPFLDLKKELFEIDTRFSQLGDRGIFRALDEARLLDHDLPGIGNIAHAVALPPATGRAHVRGEAIRMLARRRHVGAAEWQGVWDRKTGRMLDLRDPFVDRATWQKWIDAAAAEPDWFFSL